MFRRIKVIVFWDYTKLCFTLNSSGLLAGLDELPNVVMPDNDSDSSSRLGATLELLGNVLRLREGLIGRISEGSRQELGSIKHIYSHINAMFHCRVVDLPGDQEPRIQSEWKTRAKWVDEVEVDNANISTGHGKVWALVNSDGKVPGKTAKSGVPAKQKVKREEKGQMKLTFTKSMLASKDRGNGDVAEVLAGAATLVNGREHDDITSSLSSIAATSTTPRKRRRIDISSDEEEA